MSKSVMVVDDSRIMHIQLKNLLADTEYSVVVCCKSGEEALKMYPQVNPDLVTMDILMPGMDGLETTKHLLDENPNARVIMISSLAYDDTINESDKIGAKEFLYKPLDRDKLIDAFNKALED